ncbi:hypothetical protein [Microcoleus sp. B3-D7]|uniref:hypothetical protein n=1 Tax=Microcoleus sp. B3-D7 TaxID=2818659 RepID=UPI002FD51A29
MKISARLGVLHSNHLLSEMGIPPTASRWWRISRGGESDRWVRAIAKSEDMR